MFKHKKIKTVTEQAQLQSLINSKDKFINYYQSYDNPHESFEWKSYWHQITLMQWEQHLIWENCPNGLNSMKINRMLFYSGSLVGFMYLNKFYLLPFSNNLVVNMYGDPTGVTPLAFNGDGSKVRAKLPFKITLTINPYGDFDPAANGVLLHAHSPRWNTDQVITPHYLTLRVIDNMVNIMGRLKNQIKHADTKNIISISDMKQAELIHKQMEYAYSSLSPYVIISEGMILSNDKIDSGKNNAIDMWFHLKGYDDLRNMIIGTPNNGYDDKQQRKIVSEDQGKEAQTKLISDTRLAYAQQFLDYLKKQFPDNREIQNWTVRLNTSVDVEQTNDNYHNDETPRPAQGENNG